MARQQLQENAEVVWDYSVTQDGADGLLCVPVVVGSNLNDVFGDILHLILYKLLAVPQVAEYEDVEVTSEFRPKFPFDHLADVTLVFDALRPMVGADDNFDLALYGHLLRLSGLADKHVL